MVTNTNFPAALQVLALLGTVFTIVVLGALAMYGGMTKRSWTKLALSGIAVVVATYIVLLVAFSGFSKEHVLKLGEEKYFCELDCHIAYSVASVRRAPISEGEPVLLVALRTRFDPGTISERRPKDVPLQPNPRVLSVTDVSGRKFPMVDRFQLQLVPDAEDRLFGESLRPGEAYTSTFGFSVPADAKGLKLLVASSDGPERILIGSELSFLHKKTYLDIDTAPYPADAAR